MDMMKTCGTEKKNRITGGIHISSVTEEDLVPISRVTFKNLNGDGYCNEMS